MNEFLQSKIKQNLSSVEKITCITAIADKKIIVFCVFRVFCSPSQSAVQIKQFLHLASIFSWNQKGRERKANQQLHVNYAVFQKCSLPFLLSKTFETFSRKLSILSTSGNDAYNRGGGGGWDGMLFSSL